MNRSCRGGGANLAEESGERRTAVGETTELRARHGFTLIELLVVIAIIAVFSGHSFAGCAKGPRSRPPDPMSQQSKQLALACQNYHDTHKCFPSGDIDMGFPPPRSAIRMSPRSTLRSPIGSIGDATAVRYERELHSPAGQPDNLHLGDRAPVGLAVIHPAANRTVDGRLRFDLQRMTSST